MMYMAIIYMYNVLKISFEQQGPVHVNWLHFKAEIVQI